MATQESGAVKKPQLGKAVTQVATLYNPRTWKEKGLWWTAGLFLVTYLVVVVILGIVWSRSPAEFDVREHALKLAKGDESKLVPGYVTTATAIRIAETLLDKPGGYLSNDITPPGVYLDNIPNWEFGALAELRDLARSLRNNFSRAQTQSVDDRDLQIADPQFHFNSESWILPSTESEYRKGIQALYRYLERRAEGTAPFFVRADNLRAHLELAEVRLGSLAQRLAASVGQRYYRDPSGDFAYDSDDQNSGQAQVRTPWTEIDDVFFEARGYAWALLHTLKALEIDFARVLETRNAVVAMKQVIRELEGTQDFIWSPLILNGTGFGPMANHSLIMASYISRANAGIIDLRNLLERG
jgi:hypothetical protein